ncbi:hypothetical protein NQD34_003766 [Periophthalmus magnuspinnatus]|nr:hypothetical protein NQD34_003766 [Periophthalmus magnuspinnatus]
MLVTVFCAPRDRPETIFSLDVSPELELRDFVALCEIESGIPAAEIQIVYVEQQLKDPTRALGNYGVKDGDVVELRQAERRPPPTQPAFPGLPHIDFRSITVPGTSGTNNQRNAPVRPPQQPQRSAQPSTPMAFRGSSSQGLDDPALLQQMLLASPHELSLLKERNPPLAEALLSGDLERFTKVYLEQQQDRAKREQERIRLLTADPFDLEAQAKIEEDIRQNNVEENMTIAMEEAPESFGQVVMLYINCKVNGHPVKAFVDSGAQMTIMSQACAERCNIMRLVDRRWAGIAKGVGTQKIIGRVHLAQVQIEGDFLPCSFSILEDQPMDMLLGLDMLKRHQCSIDLKKNVLLIGTTGTETRFLAEAELPECARLAYGAEGREEARPEEIADRELAEALQRSIQESDTADGQTTSPQLPTPVSLPKTLNQMSSTYSKKPPSPTPGPSSMVPVDSTSSTGQNQDLNQPGPSQSHITQQIDSSVSPTASPITTDALPTSPMSTEMEGEGSITDQVSTDDIKSTTNPELDLSPVQPMEQEALSADAPHQLDSVEMAPPSVSEGSAPESEHRTRSNSIPSLAAALKELHELIVSNKSSDGSSSPPPRLSVTDNPETCQTESSCTAISQTTDAKVDHHATNTSTITTTTTTTATAVSDEGLSDCAELSSNEDNVEVEMGESLEELKTQQCPEEETSVQDIANLSNDPLSEIGQEIVSDDHNREHDVTETERAASNNNLQTVSPLNLENEQNSIVSDPAPASPQEDPLASILARLSSQSVTPQTVVGRFPIEHIQRIQAAGFSAQEAAEALERANGEVERALFALLARSIIVPT